MSIKRIKKILMDVYGYTEKDFDAGYADNGCFVNGHWLSVEEVIHRLRAAEDLGYFKEYDNK